jgi:hypothetical protein
MSQAFEELLHFSLARLGGESNACKLFLIKVAYEILCDKWEEQKFNVQYKQR